MYQCSQVSGTHRGQIFFFAFLAPPAHGGLQWVFVQHDVHVQASRENVQIRVGVCLVVGQNRES